MNTAGIDVYVVGVSSKFNKHTFECLVPSNKIGTRILTIPQFQANMFWTMEAKLRQVVCPIVMHDVYATLALAMFGDYGYYHGEYQFVVPSITFIVCALMALVCWKRGSDKVNEYGPLLEMESYSTV